MPYLFYSKSKSEHWLQLAEVFDLIRSILLIAKESKCNFIMDKVEYSGHFIFATGVETDPRKFHAISNWPFPKGVKVLRSFWLSKIVLQKERSYTI